MQSITTKFLPATNSRGPRVKAKAQVGTVTVNWDDFSDVPENHRRAAEALAAKYGWDFDLASGELPDGTGYAFVPVLPHTVTRRPAEAVH